MVGDGLLLFYSTLIVPHQILIFFCPVGVNEDLPTHDCFCLFTYVFPLVCANSQTSSINVRKAQQTILTLYEVYSVKHYG